MNEGESEEKASHELTAIALQKVERMKGRRREAQAYAPLFRAFGLVEALQKHTFHLATTG
jgi:hypothetical protein